jgi:Skp family chaperone for outer membrane proteins
MTWLEHLFHEPKDPEVETIKADLKAEKARHNRELTKIQEALADLGADYERAEQERREA